jgi:hypothetical protein
MVKYNQIGVHTTSYIDFATYNIISLFFLAFLYKKILLQEACKNHELVQSEKQA